MNIENDLQAYLYVRAIAMRGADGRNVIYRALEDGIRDYESKLARRANRYHDGMTWALALTQEKRRSKWLEQTMRRHVAAALTPERTHGYGRAFLEMHRRETSDIAAAQYSGKLPGGDG